jgi:lipoate---protein ligase
VPLGRHIEFAANDERRDRMKSDLGALHTWRRLPADCGSSADHTRRSDALSRLANGPTVWWHWTEDPTIILGAGQQASGVDLEACKVAGVRVIKRNSGGASVYADPSLLGLDVALPPLHPLLGEDVVESYRWLGEVWLHALDFLGIAGNLVSIDESRAQRRTSAPEEAILRLACFGTLSPYEVVVDGRKLVGLSQVRRTGRALFQSGVYLTFRAEPLSELLVAADRVTAVRTLERVATGLDVAAGREISRNEVMQAFARALADRVGVVEEDGTWTAEEMEYITQRAAEA